MWGAIAGFTSNGGVLSSIKSGLVTGILWAVFGLIAGALYGLWAGRAVSARRLKGLGPLLPPDTSAVLAWSEGNLTQRALGRPLLGRKLKGKSRREMAYLGLTGDAPDGKEETVSPPWLIRT